jgi:Tol biopolymer transport system component
MRRQRRLHLAPVAAFWAAAAVAVASTDLVSTAAPAAASAPTGRIVFSCYPNVCTVKPDGSGRKQLTHEKAGSGFDSGPAWSPNGKQIAFNKRSSSGGSTIYVMTAGGSQRHKVAHEGLSDELSRPAWTPDGKDVLYSVGGSGNAYRVPAGGGTAKKIHLSALNTCKDGQIVGTITESSHGVLAYSGATSGYSVGSGTLNDPIIPHFQLYKAPGSGGTPTQLTNDRNTDFGEPAWSPNGKLLAYDTVNQPYTGSVGTGCDQHSDTYTQGPVTIEIRSGSSVQTLVSSTAADPVSSPTWSPSGTEIAYDASGTIRTIPAAGGTSHPVTTGNSPDWGP